jgi:hypothetical protein
MGAKPKRKGSSEERRPKMDPKKVNGSGSGNANEWRVKVGLAEMLKGGVIMDVTNAEQAKIAEKAGASASHRTSARKAAWRAWLPSK